MLNWLNSWTNTKRNEMKWRGTREDCLTGWVGWHFVSQKRQINMLPFSKANLFVHVWNEPKQSKKDKENTSCLRFQWPKIPIQKAMNCWLVDFKWYVVQYSFTQTHICCFCAFCLLNLFAFVSFVRDQCANTRATPFWWRTKIGHR